MRVQMLCLWMLVSACGSEPESVDVQISGSTVFAEVGENFPFIVPEGVWEISAYVRGGAGGGGGGAGGGAATTTTPGSGGSGGGAGGSASGVEAFLIPVIPGETLFVGVGAGGEGGVGGPYPHPTCSTTDEVNAGSMDQLCGHAGTDGGWSFVGRPPNQVLLGSHGGQFGIGGTSGIAGERGGKRPETPGEAGRSVGPFVPGIIGNAEAHRAGDMGAWLVSEMCAPSDGGYGGAGGQPGDDVIGAEDGRYPFFPLMFGVGVQGAAGGRAGASFEGLLGGGGGGAGGRGGCGHDYVKPGEPTYATLEDGAPRAGADGGDASVSGHGGPGRNGLDGRDGRINGRSGAGGSGGSGGGPGILGGGASSRGGRGGRGSDGLVIISWVRRFVRVTK